MGPPSWPQMTRRICSSFWIAGCLQPLNASLETLLPATAAFLSGWTAHKQGLTISSCGGECRTSAQCSCRRLCSHSWEYTDASSHCRRLENGTAHPSSASTRPTTQLHHCTVWHSTLPVPQHQLQPQHCQEAMLRQDRTAEPRVNVSAFGACLRQHAAYPQIHTALVQHCSSATTGHLRMLVHGARQQQCTWPAEQQRSGRCLHTSSALTQKSDKPEGAVSSSASTDNTGSSGGEEEEYEGLQVYLDGIDDTAFGEFEGSTAEGEEGEDFDSEWVDGSVINTPHDADAESDLEYDVEFDEAWEDEEEVDDLRDPEVKSG